LFIRAVCILRACNISSISIFNNPHFELSADAGWRAFHKPFINFALSPTQILISLPVIAE